MKLRLFTALAMSVVILFGITACGSDSGNSGGELKMVYSSEVTSINYLDATTEAEMAIAANVVDNLIEYDKYGVVKPALATEWNVSDDGLVWTFTLRKGVKWVTSDGSAYADVKAQDFVDGAEWILNSNNNSKNADLLMNFVNASEYYDPDNTSVTDFSQVGIKAPDDYTVEYTLSQPLPYFLSMMTYTCFLPVNKQFLDEQGDMFGTDSYTLLYNGSFILETFEPQTRHVFVKNQKYWDKDNVYISKITETYNKEASTLSPEMFIRGEVSSSTISTAILEQWMNDPEKKDLVRPSMNGYYSYFYALNFDPQFDAQYEPENWKAVVNNESFRKSLFHALDRVRALKTSEPYNPESLVINTVTVRNFVDLNGKDYTTLGDLSSIYNTDTFDKNKALEYKASALTELDGKATFPVKVLLPYRSDSDEWAKRSLVIEQQMEELLGKDYIDIIVEAGPANNFLSEVRRSGKFALLECNWGPDYADPETYTDPFYEGTYSKPQFAENFGSEYYALIEAAKAETIDMQARLEAFAKAEALLLNKSIVIPYSVNNPGYVCSYLNPFEAQYSPFGVSYLRYKGQKVLEKPMTTDEFNSAMTVWERERSEALAKAAK